MLFWVESLSASFLSSAFPEDVPDEDADEFELTGSSAITNLLGMLVVGSISPARSLKTFLTGSEICYGRERDAMQSPPTRI